MRRRQPSFDFLEFLATDGHLNEENGHNGNGHAPDRLPSLQELSEQHGVSISVLREQLRVARALGLVEVKPRTGIRRLPYSFAPAVQESLLYAITRDRSRFDQFSDLRRHIEKIYWAEAVGQLTDQDLKRLRTLLDRADQKLHGDPIRLPHAEHRDLHLTIFSRLENPFVTGLLEAYWEAYDEVGLSRYERLSYLEKVWDFHRQIVEALEQGDFDAGYRALSEHFDLIDQRPANE